MADIYPFETSNSYSLIDKLIVSILEKQGSNGSNQQWRLNENFMNEYGELL